MIDEFWACERPEAKPEPLRTRFHTFNPCRGCWIAIEAAARREPDHVWADGEPMQVVLDRVRRINSSSPWVAS